MAFVQRANVVLEVNDDAVERMRDMGYSVIDSQGNILQGSNVKTVGELQTEVMKLKAICDEQEHQIRMLMEECDKLRVEIAASKKKSTSSTKKK